MGANVTIYEGREQRTFQNVQKILTSGDTYWITEDDANAQTAQEFTDLYENRWGGVDVSGEWNLADTIRAPSYPASTYDISFTSNGQSFNALTLSYSGSQILIQYGTTYVYGANGWTNDEYKAIEITGGTDVASPELAYLLYYNSTNDYTDKERLEACLNIIARKFLDDAGGQTATIETLARTMLFA